VNDEDDDNMMKMMKMMIGSNELIKDKEEESE